LNNKPKRDLVIRVEGDKKFIRGGSIVELVDAACRNLYGGTNFSSSLCHSSFFSFNTLKLQHSPLLKKIFKTVQ
jgi:hypothetical protein